MLSNLESTDQTVCLFLAQKESIIGVQIRDSELAAGTATGVCELSDEHKQGRKDQAMFRFSKLNTWLE